MPTSEPLVSSGTRAPVLVSCSAISGISLLTVEVRGRTEDAGTTLRWSERRGTVRPDAWVAACRPSADPPAGLQDLAGPVSGSRARLRRDLPRPPRRRGPHVGDPPRRAPRPRAHGDHAPRAGRDHRDGLRDLAAPARGRAVGDRGLPPAPPLRARRPRPRRRLRGPLRPPRRAPAAAEPPRRPPPRPPRADADHGRGRGRDAAARPRRHQVVVLRDRRGAEPPLP